MVVDNSCCSASFEDEDSVKTAADSDEDLEAKKLTSIPESEVTISVNQESTAISSSTESIPSKHLGKCCLKSCPDQEKRKSSIPDDNMLEQQHKQSILKRASTISGRFNCRVKKATHKHCCCVLERWNNYYEVVVQKTDVTQCFARKNGVSKSLLHASLSSCSKPTFYNII